MHFILLLAIACSVTLLALLIIHLVKSKSHTPPQKLDIISFSGGGLRAISSDVGVIHGIRKRMGGDLATVLNNYRIMGGISGGSWFMSLLIYSPTFYNMLDKGEISDSSGYTYETYVENVIKAIDNMEGWGKHCTHPKSYIKELECWMIDHMKKDLPRGFLEMVQYGFQPWQITVEEMIFSHVDNMKNAKLSDNPNKVNLHCVWGSSIMKSGTLESTDIGEKNYYDMPDPINKYCVIGECGLAFPISFNYDHKKSMSTTNIFTGQTNMSTQIEYHITKTKTSKTTNALNQTPPTNLYVKDVAACSGAALGFASSEDIVEQIYKSDIKLGDINVSQILSEFVRKFGSKMGIAMNLEGSNNQLGFNKTGYVPVDQQAKNVTVRAIDGGFYDDSSVAFSIKAWQENSLNLSNICHIVNVNAMMNTMSDQTAGSKTNTAISYLFGSTVDGDKCMPVVDDAKAYGLDKWGLKINLTLPVIFPCDDFKKGVCLWWGREDINNKCEPCSTSNKYCVEISVHLYETVTVDNKELGIVGGTPVHLYVINTNTNTPIFPLPEIPLSQLGEFGATNPVENYTSSAGIISNLMQKIPEDIFNAMFRGDQLKGVRMTCGKQPVC